MSRKRSLRCQDQETEKFCSIQARRNNNRTISGLARGVEVSRQAMQQLIHEDLGMKSFVTDLLVNAEKSFQLRSVPLAKRQRPAKVMVEMKRAEICSDGSKTILVYVP